MDTVRLFPSQISDMNNFLGDFDRSSRDAIKIQFSKYSPEFLAKKVLENTTSTSLAEPLRVWLEKISTGSAPVYSQIFKEFFLDIAREFYEFFQSKRSREFSSTEGYLHDYARRDFPDNALEIIHGRESYTQHQFYRFIVRIFLDAKKTLAESKEKFKARPIQAYAKDRSRQEAMKILELAENEPQLVGESHQKRAVLEDITNDLKPKFKEAFRIFLESIFKSFNLTLEQLFNYLDHSFAFRIGQANGAANREHKASSTNPSQYEEEIKRQQENNFIGYGGEKIIIANLVKAFSKDNSDGNPIPDLSLYTHGKEQPGETIGNFSPYDFVFTDPHSANNEARRVYGEIKTTSKPYTDSKDLKIPFTQVDKAREVLKTGHSFKFIFLRNYKQKNQNQDSYKFQDNISALVADAESLLFTPYEYRIKFNPSHEARTSEIKTRGLNTNGEFIAHIRTRPADALNSRNKYYYTYTLKALVFRALKEAFCLAENPVSDFAKSIKSSLESLKIRSTEMDIEDLENHNANFSYIDTEGKKIYVRLYVKSEFNPSDASPSFVIKASTLKNIRSYKASPENIGYENWVIGVHDTDNSQGPTLKISVYDLMDRNFDELLIASKLKLEKATSSSKEISWTPHRYSLALNPFSEKIPENISFKNIFSSEVAEEDKKFQADKLKAALLV
jgi:hypothetical protein